MRTDAINLDPAEQATKRTREEEPGYVVVNRITQDMDTNQYPGGSNSDSVSNNFVDMKQKAEIGGDNAAGLKNNLQKCSRMIPTCTKGLEHNEMSLPITGQTPDRDGDSANTQMEYEHDVIKFQYQKNILILGTVGAGKATLANKIADKETFSSQSNSMSSNARKPDIRSEKLKNATECFDHNFLLIDIFGPFQNYNITCERLKAEFDRNFIGGVNLIILAVRKDSSSTEEIEVLNYIINKRFSELAKKCIALVFTACEGLGSSKREEFAKKFKFNNPNARSVYDYAIQGKGVFFVGFPPLDDVDESFSAMYKEMAKNSQADMEKLVSGCRTQLHFLEVFLGVKKGKASWNLLPQRESNPVCRQS